MPKLRFFVSSQNIEKWATNVVSPKETTQLRTVSNVSKVHIQLLSCLVLSNFRGFFV